MDNGTETTMGSEPDEAGRGQITRLLERLHEGGDDALEELIAFVYEQLRRIATGLVRRERSGFTLRATDVVHEAYFRLFDDDRPEWDDRKHFFTSAAIAMRRVLIDYSRRTDAAKRIPKDELVPIVPGSASDPGVTPNFDILALDQALDRLAEVDGRQAQIVELRYFAGLTSAEVAELLGISRGTVTREWRAAKLWLRRDMQG